MFFSVDYPKTGLYLLWQSNKRFCILGDIEISIIVSTTIPPPSDLSPWSILSIQPLASITPRDDGPILENHPFGQGVCLLFLMPACTYPIHQSVPPEHQYLSRSSILDSRMLWLPDPKPEIKKPVPLSSKHFSVVPTVGDPYHSPPKDLFQ